MATIVQFVDSIASSPAVRVDLNSVASGLRVLADGGIDLPLPEIQRAVTSTLLSDGDRIVASAYGNRVVGLVLRATGSSADVTATTIQTLARELDRVTNILKVQLEGMTAPVFFRTFQASDYTMSVMLAQLARNTQLTLTIPAEPFALGLKQTISAFTVAKDPAAGTNPCRFDLVSTDVIGDVETPAQIKIVNTAAGMSIRQGIIAVRARGTPSACPFLVQAEAMTMGTDTTVQANNTSFSGAGSNFVSCTFATGTAMDERLSTTVPASASVDARGRYRVFLRCKRGTSGSGINVRLTIDGAGTSVALPTAFGTGIGILDLGSVDIPGGMDPVTDGPTGVQLPASGRFIAIDAERVSGSGTFDIDYMLLVPADYRCAVINYGMPAANAPCVLDAGRDLIYQLDASGNVQPPDTPAMYFLGGLPLLTPNVAQRIYFVQSCGIEGLLTAPTTLQVTVAYWPRYLDGFRPAAT